MRKRYLIVFMMFTFAIAYPQPKDDIVLPKGGQKYEKVESLAEFEKPSLYITKEQVVFIEKVKLEYFNSISYFLFHFGEMNPPHVFVIPRLYADTDTHFDFIQRVIHQTAMMSSKIEFATQENKSIRKDVSTLLKIDKSRISTLKEEIVVDFDIVPPPIPWWLAARTDMYSGNVKKVKNVLSEHKYAVIKVLSNQRIEHKGQILSETKMADLLRENDILFIRFDENLFYKDFIYAIDFVNQIAKKVEAITKSSAYPIEVFSELEEFMIENDITF